MATVVVFSGDYDVTSMNELRRELDRLAFEADVTLDLTDVTFIDSTSLAEFFRLHRLRQANELGTLTLLLKPESPFHRLLSVSGVLNSFRIFETIDETIPKTGESVRVRYAFSQPGAPVSVSV